MPLPDLLSNAILFVFIPAWLISGFGDWIFHRLTHISKTSGFKESLLHQLMMAELGLPLLAGLFLDINALVIGIMILGFLLHEITVLLDLRYSSKKRRIPPGEQIVHSFQELIPLTILSLVIFLHWDQFIALVTLNEEARFSLQRKHDPLPQAYLVTLLAAACLLVVVPFVEELWRCLRDGDRRRT